MGKRIRSFFAYVGLGMLLLTGLDSYGQTLAKHNWYFGSTQRSIRFNRVTNVSSLVTNKAIPFGTGGSAVATDRGNGNLLFYTDGNRIYDANHRAMPNIGAGLNANILGNQPVAICPVPGQKGKYFVFTNTADFTTGGNISYSVVDMNLFGASTFPAPGFGDVESRNNPIGSLAGVSEGMITLPHANGRDFWLVTQNVNALTFNATLINAASYTANTFNTIVSTTTNATTTIAHLAYHEGLKKLAAAPQEAGIDAVILNFAEASGAITLDRPILNSAVNSTTPQAIYDIEWSASGRYLYLSRHGEAAINGDVLQYDYNNASITLASVLPAPVFRSYGLQRGPDSLIYHLYQTSAASPFLLGRIDRPDSVASKAAYNAAPKGFAALDFGGKQFPGFVPKDSIDLKVDFTFAGTCQKSPTTFFPFVRPGADSLQWDLGNGAAVSAWSPIYTYATAGTFHVTLRAFYQGQVKTAQHDVVINTFALTLQMTKDTTACKEEFPPPRGSSSPKQFSVKVNVQGGTPASIAWSNGDTGATLTPDSAGYYYVVVTDAGGCSAYAGVNVKEYGLQTQTRNKWYFGNKAGIDFTTSKALNESAMNAPEGCAIACDKNGQQIVYTDGNTVWDKTHTVIATGIGGNPASSQSSLIVPVPGDETMYYIFTSQAINGSDSLQLNYSMFDLKQNSGKGSVVKKGVLLFMKSGEQVTANGQWLVVHELGNSTFRSYSISATGIGNQVYSSSGTDHSLAIKENGEGYIKLGPRDLVAVPISTPTVSNRIELFHLNDTTGSIGNYKNIDLNEPNGQIYGVEFSPAGNKLFASVKYTGGSSAIYEYSIDSLFRPRFRQKIPVTAELGAIQIGPDGQVYVAVNNAGNNTSLGVIAANEDTLATSSFNLNGFPLAAGTNSWLGLPNFIEQNSSAAGGPGITVTGLCAKDSTHFSGSPRDQIDSYNWSVFHNGAFLATSNQATFALLLPGPGNYSVTLQLHNRCAPDTTMSKKFVVTPPPLSPSQGIPLCNTPTVNLDANPTNAPALTYQWLTGETTKIVAVSEPGVYEVNVTDTLGCTTHGTFLTADSRPIFDLGPDVTICQGDNTAALNVGNAGLTIAWTVDGVATGNTPRQSVNVATPGVFTYAVTVTDPLTKCFRAEDKIYTVNVSPLINMTGINPTSCGTATGSVTLNINASAPPGGPMYTYLLSGPGGTLDGFDEVAGGAFTLNNVTAGTYSAFVTDQVSGCQSSQAFGLSDAVFTASALPDPPNCDPVTLTVTTNAVAFPLAYTATNSATGVATTGTFALAPPPPLKIPLLAAGTYVIELKDAGGCIRTFNQAVTPGAPLPVTIAPDLCAMTLTVPAGATSYAWTASSPTGFTGSTTGNVLTLAPNAGNVTYSVTVTPAAGCPGIDSVTLNVGNIPTPTLSQTTPCADLATISVVPAGAFNYRWTVNGVYDGTLGGSSAQIGLVDNGKVYSVQIFEPQSGCTKNSANFPAEVSGLVDATLESTPPCQDGQPIKLSAKTQAVGASFVWKREGTAIAGTDSANLQTLEGLYSVEVTKGSCKATATLVIARSPLPEGSLPNLAIICDDPENTDDASKQTDLDPGIFIEYDWTKNGASLNYTDRVYTADSKGSYQVKITDARRCTNIDKTEIINDCLPIVNGPNAFRPGSTAAPKLRPDLTNSDFWIFTRFIEDEQFKVFIFNRWGEMVYSSADRFFKWNGGFNNDIGRPAPPGTYSYVVQYVSAFRPDKGVQEKRGGVALIR